MKQEFKTLKSQFLNQVLEPAVDQIMSMLPQREPPVEVLNKACLIGHRGTCSVVGIKENTLSAFSHAIENSAWGIELDVHLTQDLVPVVSHDPDLRRVFHIDRTLADLSFQELRQIAPEVPSLNEVISLARGRAHLMVEMKTINHVTPSEIAIVMQEALAGLSPLEEFHLLGLSANIFDAFQWLDPRAQIAVAITNTEEMSQLALERDLGGLAGHYLLMTNQICQRHRLRQQKLGTGFVSSRNVLYRELNRRIDWIFTNHIANVGGLLPNG